MEIIAHRGYGHTPTPSGQKPQHIENTYPALAAAVTRGLPVEFDVRITSDSQAVVSHDDVLEGPNMTLSIAKTPLDLLQSAGLAAYSAGDRLAAPTLKMVLNHLWGRVPLHVELKSAGSARATFEVIRELGLPPVELAGYLVVSSFILGELAEFRRKHPSVPAFWLRENWQTTAPGDDILEALKTNNLQGVHLEIALAIPEVVSWFRGNGYIVRVYIVNDPAMLAGLAERGVTGIFTDQPDLMVAANRQLNK